MFLLPIWQWNILSPVARWLPWWHGGLLCNSKFNMNDAKYLLMTSLGRQLTSADGEGEEQYWQQSTLVASKLPILLLIGLRTFQDFYQLSLLIQSLPWRGTTFKISNHIPDCISDHFATSLQPLLPVEFHFLHILWTNLFVKSWIKFIQFYYLSTYILSNSL